MITTLVHVWVQEQHVNDFVRASIVNHNASIQEPGNLRFDILQDAGEPTKFVLYEAYESVEAAAAHKKTTHYLKWRDTVAGWMAQPRKGEQHLILAPKDRKLW